MQKFVKSSDDYRRVTYKQTKNARLKRKSIYFTGKSLLALIFASNNLQYDDSSLNNKFNTSKFQAQTWGEHVVYRNCFRYSEQFLYTTCSPHVLQKEELLRKIYL